MRKAKRHRASDTLLREQAEDIQAQSGVSPKLALDVLGQGAGIVVSCVLNERIEVLSHDGVQHRRFRLSSLVGAAGSRAVDVERQLLGDGLGMG